MTVREYRRILKDLDQDAEMMIQSRPLAEGELPVYKCMDRTDVKLTQRSFDCTHDGKVFFPDNYPTNLDMSGVILELKGFTRTEE